MALRKFLCSAGDNPDLHQSPKASPKVINVEYGELRDSGMRQAGQGDGKRRGAYQKFSDEKGATIEKFCKCSWCC